MARSEYLASGQLASLQRPAVGQFPTSQTGLTKDGFSDLPNATGLAQMLKSRWRGYCVAQSVLDPKMLYLIKVSKTPTSSNCPGTPRLTFHPIDLDLKFQQSGSFCNPVTKLPSLGNTVCSIPQSHAHMSEATCAPFICVLRYSRAVLLNIWRDSISPLLLHFNRWGESLCFQWDSHLRRWFQEGCRKVVIQRLKTAFLFTTTNIFPISFAWSACIIPFYLKLITALQCQQHTDNATAPEALIYLCPSPNLLMCFFI